MEGELNYSGRWLITAEELQTAVKGQDNSSHSIDNEYLNNLLPILFERLENDCYSHSPLAPSLDE